MEAEGYCDIFLSKQFRKGCFLAVPCSDLPAGAVAGLIPVAAFLYADLGICMGPSEGAPAS